MNMWRKRLRSREWWESLGRTPRWSPPPCQLAWGERRGRGWGRLPGSGTTTTMAQSACGIFVATSSPEMSAVIQIMKLDRKREYTLTFLWLDLWTGTLLNATWGLNCLTKWTDTESWNYYKSFCWNSRRYSQFPLYCLLWRCWKLTNDSKSGVLPWTLNKRKDWNTLSMLQRLKETDISKDDIRVNIHSVQRSSGKFLHFTIGRTTDKTTAITVYWSSQNLLWECDTCR